MDNIAPLAQALQGHIICSTLTSWTLLVSPYQSHIPKCSNVKLSPTCATPLTGLKTSGSSVAPINWSSVEISVGIISACLPTLQPVLGVLGRKFLETASSWSGRSNKGKDLRYLESPARQQGGTPPNPDKKMTTLQLSLGNVSWRAPDYEGFGYDDAFKEVGMKDPSP